MILIAGGFDPNGNALNTTELFDPASDTFATGPTMVSPHAQHTATLLQDGTVLIAGGCGSSGAYNQTYVAEIYNPASNTMTQVGNTTKPRQDYAASLLNSGEVLLAGGYLSTESTADIYEPSTQSFSVGAGYGFFGFGQSLVHLANDQVLLFGSPYLNQAQLNGELYTPASGMFSFTSGTTPNPGIHMAMLLLPDQTAVIFEGGTSGLNPAIPVGRTVNYNPSTQSFSALPSGAERRTYPTATFVPGVSQVVVAGGVPVNSGTSNGTAVELFDATQKTWSAGGQMSTARTGMTSTYFTNTSTTATASQTK